MSATYAIDSVQHLVRTHVSGVVTSAQLASMYAAMSADPAFSSTYFQLADWREVTSLEVQPTAVRQAAGAHPFDPGTRRAIVVGIDVVYGVARIFAAYSENVGQNVQVFRDMADAEAWLVA